MDWAKKKKGKEEINPEYEKLFLNQKIERSNKESVKNLLPEAGVYLF